MIKTINKIFIVILLIVGFCLYPIPTNAEEILSNYYDVNTSASIINEDINITNIVFKDNTTTSTMSYGLTGNIINKTNNTNQSQITVTFYNINYDVIAQNTIEKIISPNSQTTYTQMLNVNTVPENYTINDIKYYTIKIAPVEEITSIQEDYTSLPYVIDSYDINIIVNKNNTLDITEKLNVYFNEPCHGIYRKIPIKNKIIRLDGSSFTSVSKISKLKVSDSYTTSNDFIDYEIKIGDENTTITGDKQYTISYRYSIGNDRNKEYDELYFNIIGTQWDTIIKNVNFSIEMPKEFDASKLGFSSGTKTSTDTSNITYEVTKNKIVGKVNKVLNKNEGVTVRLELEEGYFEESVISKGMNYLIFFIPFICLIISISIWHKYGKDDKVVEVINFYPPENMNSLDLAFNYNGKATDTDVVSLLIYLANKGYISITEEHFEKYSHGDFSIKKLKDYDGTNKLEAMFLEELFKCKKKSKKTIEKLTEREKELHKLSDVVTSNDLQYKFHTTISKIIRSTNTSKNEKKIFVKGTEKKNWIIILLMLLVYILIIAVPSYKYSSLAETALTLIISAMYIPFFAMLFIPNIQPSIRIFMGLFITVHFIAFAFTLPISTALSTELIYVFSTIFGVICIIGMAICLTLMPKRTSYGNEILGQIRGFKTFLETAEKDKLEELVEENPNYFYDILPYTYVLGVSRKWISKFETIALAEPDWYHTTETFNLSTFGKSINRTFSSANNQMSKTTSSSGGSSSSSGGSSGGGSSGGGSGGGGGGSW